MRNSTLPDGQTALYRFYGPGGELLYVGITNDIEARFSSHSSKSTWYKHASAVSVWVFETRAIATAAEKLAIENEHPIFNVVHNDYVPKVTARDYKSVPDRLIAACSTNVLRVALAMVRAKNRGEVITDEVQYAMTFSAVREYELSIPYHNGKF